MFVKYTYTKHISIVFGYLIFFVWLRYLSFNAFSTLTWDHLNLVDAVVLEVFCLKRDKRKAMDKQHCSSTPINSLVLSWLWDFYTAALFVYEFLLLQNAYPYYGYMHHLQELFYMFCKRSTTRIFRLLNMNVRM